MGKGNRPSKEWIAQQLEVMPKKPALSPYYEGWVTGFLFGVVVGMGFLFGVVVGMAFLVLV